ncbi:MAG: YqaA family protein [Candidatus Thalassarchaeaceae archaeon]|jgi:undecaprenyl-diphosphatase|nr:YqaA family protein [Candidatus Thalassarchaeaceae archaeon]
MKEIRWNVSMGWKESILDAFDNLGEGSLAALSFTEAIIQPVPPDLLYMPMVYADKTNTTTVLWLWTVVTITSVAGSLVGHWIGQHWGRNLLERYANPKHVTMLENLTEKYGTAGIFIAAFSPIPYKVFGWVAGMGEMDRRTFAIAGLFGRGLRFGLEAIAIVVWGDEALSAAESFVENEFALGAMSLAIIGLISWFLVRKQMFAIPSDTEE